VNNQFDERVAIVTGATRGIGYSIARELLVGGAAVCITGRKPEPLGTAVQSLSEFGRVIGVAGRADDPEHQRETVDRVVSELGQVRMLVNCAGTNPFFGPLIDLPVNAARKTLEVNCLAALGWSQAVWHRSMADVGGAILNVSAIGADRPAQGLAFYGASKAMLNHLTRGLAVELAPKVRVNAVSPGLVRTQFSAALLEDDNAAAAYPMARVGEPEDVARLAAFLLSDDASWITGEIVVIDGGVTLVSGS
jgi:NAD(P)-dependent dehydrogenase (short-subunit alcohol dehydrogenase family)